MDKLKLAFSIIAKHAREKRSTGEVPIFLGTHAMLALMYDRIAKFTSAASEYEDTSKYVLELAVMGVFAFSTVLPEMEIKEDEIPDEIPDEEVSEQFKEKPDESDVVDPRWTAVRPGDPLPTTAPIKEENE